MGDLAIVVRARHRENLGCIVEVIAPGEPNELVSAPYWHCLSRGRPLKLTYLGTQKTAVSENVFFYDDDLQPIRGNAAAPVAREVALHE